MLRDGRGKFCCAGDDDGDDDVFVTSNPLIGGKLKNSIKYLHKVV